MRDNPRKIVKDIKDSWAKAIINWEKTKGRTFSWRENRTPYRILIAEILLKRTTSTAAIGLYEEFLDRYPDLKSLNNAPSAELELLLQPIGLYRQRASQIKRLAEYVNFKFDGELPLEYELLLELPGIGEYTASSILCFSYNKPKAIVDSNVERILSRAFKVEGKELKDIAEILVSEYDSNTYNYGLLDLGALICHYRYPKCPECPVKHYCFFWEEIQ